MEWYGIFEFRRGNGRREVSLAPMCWFTPEHEGSKRGTAKWPSDKKMTKHNLEKLVVNYVTPGESWLVHDCKSLFINLTYEDAKAKELCALQEEALETDTTIDSEGDSDLERVERLLEAPILPQRLKNVYQKCSKEVKYKISSCQTKVCNKENQPPFNISAGSSGAIDAKTWEVMEHMISKLVTCEGMEHMISKLVEKNDSFYRKINSQFTKIDVLTQTVLGLKFEMNNLKFEVTAIKQQMKTDADAVSVVNQKMLTSTNELTRLSKSSLEKSAGNNIELKHLLNSFQSSSISSTTPNRNFPICFPAQSKEELLILEDNVKDPLQYKALVEKLRSLGGTNFRSLLFNMMRFLMSMSVCMTFSMQGQRLKDSFAKLHICSLVIDAAKQSILHRLQTDREIHVIMGNCLASARPKDEVQKQNALPNTVPTGINIPALNVVREANEAYSATSLQFTGTCSGSAVVPQDANTGRAVVWHDSTAGSSKAPQDAYYYAGTTEALQRDYADNAAAQQDGFSGSSPNPFVPLVLDL